MHLLAISDIHGNLDNIEKLSEQFKEVDAVLFAGDFAEFSKTETGLPVLEKLVSKHDQIFAVRGNCDEVDFIDEMDKYDICVEKSVSFFDGLAISGSGGGSKFTGTTPNEREEEDLVSDFSVLNDDSEGDKKWHNLIAIMHNPPKDTKCDMIPNGIHVGSAMLRDFIEKTEPLAVITGHIHESSGIDNIGNTVVINPGSLAEGKYAILDVEKVDGNWKVTKSELKTL